MKKPHNYRNRLGIPRTPQGDHYEDTLSLIDKIVVFILIVGGLVVFGPAIWDVFGP